MGGGDAPGRRKASRRAWAGGGRAGAEERRRAGVDGDAPGRRKASRWRGPAVDAPGREQSNKEEPT